MSDRRAFLAHLVISSAVACGFAFAWQRGVPQTVFADPVARWFGGAIGLVLVAAIIALGRQSWRDDPEASFGHLAVWLSPSIGMLGTVVGLTMVFQKLGSQDALAGASTAFYSTGCGLVSMIVCMVLTYSLETTIARDGQ